MQSSPSLIICGLPAWPGPTSESAGLIRLHVADARGDGREFYRSPMRHRDGPNAHRRRKSTDRAARGQDWQTRKREWRLWKKTEKSRCYLTSFSNGRRRWPCDDFESRDLSAGASSGNIASHKAFNSESAIRWSFIRRSRIATDSNCAVSRSRLSARTARHPSRVARTECNRSSELATGVFSVTELAR